MFKGRDIISIKDFTKEEIVYVLKTAKRMENNKNKELFRGNILATLLIIV